VVDILQFGQQVCLFGHQYHLAIPDALYFIIKDMVLKLLYSKVHFALPFRNEMKHYTKNTMQSEVIIIDISMLPLTLGQVDGVV